MSRFRIHLGLAGLVLVAAIWLSSGTLSPYADTELNPQVDPQCHYLFNVDHGQFRAAFNLLDGKPATEWRYSVVLRRILYPLVAYPFMKALGFEAGGLAVNIILSLLGMVSFAVWARRRLGEDAALAVTWLYATYPGIGYWAGLPYSYAMIVPGSLWLLMLLFALDEATSWRRAALLSLAVGLLFIAYDLFPFFGPAALLLTAYRRRWRWLPVVAVGMFLPMLISDYILAHKGVQLDNSNSRSLANIPLAYLHKPDWVRWWGFLRELPGNIVENYLFGNFVFIPVLFLILIVLRRRPALVPVEKALLATGVVVFLFLNLAPPYPGWQLRGTVIPRLYQPLFVAFFYYAARSLADASPVRRRLLIALLAITIGGNAIISFGPIVNSPISSVIYYRFYKFYAGPDAMQRHLTRWGRRPLGLCK